MVLPENPILSTMVEFKERLQAAMTHAQMDRTTLAKRLKVTRVAIDKALDGRSKSMTAENCAQTARMLKVSHFWLATGIGEMHAKMEYPAPTKPDAHTVSEAYAPYDWPLQTIRPQEYQRLSERQQGQIEGQIRAMLDAIDDKSGRSQQAA